MEEQNKLPDEIMQKLMAEFMKRPQVVKEISFSRMTISLMDNNCFYFSLDGEKITMCHAKASVKDGRTLDTRSATFKTMTGEEVDGKMEIAIVFEENGLRFTNHITLLKDKRYFISVGELEDLVKETETNYIAPLDFAYPNAECKPLFLSLDQRMLLVPYDNDMWVRYESDHLRPGRTSYDVTAIFEAKTNNGMVVGALDFDTWKNAIKCSAFDARCYTAFSGVADECTHDIYPHGTLIGKTVKSARFLCGWYSDIREGMEEYGKVAMEDKFFFKWKNVVPFGWNSYSCTVDMFKTLESWNTTSEFFANELKNFKDAEGSAYINLDANFGLPKEAIQAVIKNIRARGQKPGSYMAPLAGHKLLGIFPLKSNPSKTILDVVMRDDNGKPFPTMDGSIPVDITEPDAEQNLRLTIRDLVETGFDYIKIDFLSHGAVEGKRYNKSIRTGRQALMYFYNIIKEELDPNKIGREIFVDLSIAPLFPAGYGHGRRCCCDAFGHHEDVRYILNALNYGWWTNKSLYQFADPDHTVLQQSFVDGRGQTDFYSAKSRYNASVISGTIMLLSDNYGPAGTEEQIEEARRRTIELANNPKLNEVARFHEAFKPAYLTDGTTNVYYLHHEGRNFVALFNFDGETKEISVPAMHVGMKENGTLLNLNNGKTSDYHGTISAMLGAYDSAIIEIL